MIPPEIKVKNDELPDAPGVYFYYDQKDHLLYIGKATSLKRRVGSYFVKAHTDRIGEMVSQIHRIDYHETPTVIEALILEANEIHARRPKYNILGRDDKTFLYLVITDEPYPRPQLIRGHELKVRKNYLRVFGPYTSSRSLKMALEMIRRGIPWSTCLPGQRRPCFDAQIGKCPGVCTGRISKPEYRRVIRQLILFFEGKKAKLERELKKEMVLAAKNLQFEKAALLRRRLFALEHIQDIALISREDHELPFTKKDSDGAIDLMGRIEAYDISNISGTSATGSMVVFIEGKPAKQLYRKFKIKTVKGANDVACLEEVIRRRLKRGFPPARGGTQGGGSKERGWELPEVMVIDGGEPQVNRVQEILDELGVEVPIIGIAKGFDRKQDRLVFDQENRDLQRVVTRGKELFQRARDEAHRFAVKYHRVLRGKSMKL